MAGVKKADIGSATRDNIGENAFHRCCGEDSDHQIYRKDGKNKGQIMKVVMGELKGKIDGKVIGEVMAKLIK